MGRRKLVVDDRKLNGAGRRLGCESGGEVVRCCLAFERGDEYDEESEMRVKSRSLDEFAMVGRTARPEGEGPEQSFDTPAKEGYAQNGFTITPSPSSCFATLG